MLEKVADPRLVVFAVWLPVLRRDAARHLPGALATLPDARVQHFWDPTATLGWQLSDLLALRHDDGRKRIAWDVYLLYRSGRRWGENPDAWMHQLRGLSPAQRLRGEKLAELVRASLR